MKQILKIVLLLVFALSATQSPLYAKKKAARRTNTTTTSKTSEKPSLTEWLRYMVSETSSFKMGEVGSGRYTFNNNCLTMSIYYSSKVNDIVAMSDLSHIDFVIKRFLYGLIKESPYSVDEFVKKGISFKLKIFDAEKKILKQSNIPPAMLQDVYNEIKKMEGDGLTERELVMAQVKAENAKCPIVIGDGMSAVKAAVEDNVVVYYCQLDQAATELMSFINVEDHKTFQEYRNQMAINIKRNMSKVSISRNESLGDNYLQMIKKADLSLRYIYMNNNKEEIIRLDFTADELLNAKVDMSKLKGTSSFDKYGLSFSHPNTVEAVNASDDMDLEDAIKQVFSLVSKISGAEIGVIIWSNDSYGMSEVGLDLENLGLYNHMATAFGANTQTDDAEKYFYAHPKHVIRALKGRYFSTAFDWPVYCYSFTTNGKVVNVIYVDKTQDDKEEKEYMDQAIKMILNTIDVKP
ncbi:MAG: hypothetical protein MJZ74_09300 [Muribaculaceae bacterium]|nr:hypothetical protein [Muribaculaceae bacterium]